MEKEEEIEETFHLEVKFAEDLVSAVSDRLAVLGMAYLIRYEGSGFEHKSLVEFLKDIFDALVIVEMGELGAIKIADSLIKNRVAFTCVMAGGVEAVKNGLDELADEIEKMFKEAFPDDNKTELKKHPLDAMVVDSMEELDIKKVTD